MEDFLTGLWTQFASMMDIEDATIGKNRIQDMKHLLHRPGIVFVPTVELGEGIDDDEGGLQVGHNLNQIRDVIRVIDDIEGTSQVGWVKDNEISMIRLRPKRR